jgi:hypothetical protein
MGVLALVGIRTWPALLAADEYREDRQVDGPLVVLVFGGGPVRV